MKIGLCGGTFDPFHRGHLDPILSARQTLGWDRVVYIPAYVQPFKTNRESESGYHRFAMAVLATREDDALFVSPRELERGTVSYSVDTLRELRAELPDATLDWIIGDDNLDRLHEWRSIDAIFELANFVVLTRAASSPALPEAYARRLAAPSERSTRGAMVFAANDAVPVSSTEIRRRVRAGESIDELVPPAVSRYIHHYGLYRKGQQ